MNQVIIRAKAPLRISFGGGGTDVSPYFEERGGVTVSSAIDKYAYCTLIERGDEQVDVKSLDYNLTSNFPLNNMPGYDGKLDLVKAALNVMKTDCGMDLFLHSDAPPGCGLGTSSAMAVALLGTISAHKKEQMTDYQIAERAYFIERHELGIAGGKQDQYASAFGGFNLIEYTADETVVRQLPIEREVLQELEYRSMLCYTGRTRLSGGIIQDQVQGYVEKRDDVAAALDNTKMLALRIKDTLLAGNLDELGDLLNEGWQYKKKFTSRISDPQIDEMYEEARKSGALGGKLLGAGGGGYMLFLCEFDKRHIVASRVEHMGGTIMNFTFEPRGLQTWNVRRK